MSLCNTSQFALQGIAIAISLTNDGVQVDWKEDMECEGEITTLEHAVRGNIPCITLEAGETAIGKFDVGQPIVMGKLEARADISFASPGSGRELTKTCEVKVAVFHQLGLPNHLTEAFVSHDELKESFAAQLDATFLRTWLRIAPAVAIPIDAAYILTAATLNSRTESAAAQQACVVIYLKEVGLDGKTIHAQIQVTGISEELHEILLSELQSCDNALVI